MAHAWGCWQSRLTAFPLADQQKDPAMKPALPIAAAVAIFLMSATAVPAGSLAACTGPFRQCAIDVQATCSKDPGGRLRITYWDTSGNVIRFEQCVARVFAAHGLPNPYTPAGMAAAGRGKLQVPYTE